MDQIVGRACAICNERIATVLDGRFCTTCHAAVHKECARPEPEREGTCASCGAPRDAMTWRKPAAVPGRAPGGKVSPADWKGGEPSLFPRTFTGYAIATAIGCVAIVVLSIRAGHVNVTGAMDLLLGIGSLGTLLGYSAAVRRYKAKAIGTPAEEPPRLLGSLLGYVMAAIVILGSGGLALLLQAALGSLAEGSG